MAVAALLGACSDDDEGSTTTTQPGLSVTGEGTLAGAVEGSATFEVQYPTGTESCAAVVAAGTYIVPLPTSVGTTRLSWQAGVPELRGAGTYSLDDLGGVIRLTVTAEGADPVQYRTGEGATAELVLEEDGGGSFSFAGVRDAAGAEVHGTSAWSCGRRD